MAWTINGRQAIHENGLVLEIGREGDVVNVGHMPSGLDTKELKALISHVESVIREDWRRESVVIQKSACSTKIVIKKRRRVFG